MDVIVKPDVGASVIVCELCVAEVNVALAPLTLDAFPVVALVVDVSVPATEVCVPDTEIARDVVIAIVKEILVVSVSVMVALVLADASVPGKEVSVSDTAV